jgi:hypothetical protein
LEKIEKESAISGQDPGTDPEYVKWSQVLAMMQNKEPMEKIDRIVFSGIFSKSFLD